MYTAHSTGLKLVHFIDMYDVNTGIYDEVINFTKDFLNDSKRVFFTDDDAVFDKFCELFALTFCTRTMNFNTTLDFKMKLDALLLYNQMKYKRIFDASLIEINPLTTYRHSVNSTETDQGTNNENNSYNKDASSSSNYNDGSGHSDRESYDQLKDTKSFQDRKDERSGSVIHGLTNNTDNKRLVSNTPQSNVQLSNLFDENNNVYVNAVEHTKNSSVDSGTDTTSDDIEYKGTEFNTRTGDILKSGSSDASGSSSNTSNESGSADKSGGFETSKIFSELSEGFDGSQIELLDKYVNIVFDVCRTIIDDIEDACLFSSILL